MRSCFMVETCGGCNLGQSGRDVDRDGPQHQHDRLFLTVQHHIPLLWDFGGEGHSCRCCVQNGGVTRCISSTTAVTGRSMLKAQVLHKHWTKNDHGMSSRTAPSNGLEFIDLRSVDQHYFSVGVGNPPNATPYLVQHTERMQLLMNILSLNTVRP